MIVYAPKVIRLHLKLNLSLTLGAKPLVSGSRDLSRAGKAICKANILHASMVGTSAAVTIVLLIVAIACVPLTMLSKYAWRRRGLTLFFSLLGSFAVLLLIVLNWNALD